MTTGRELSKEGIILMTAAGWKPIWNGNYRAPLPAGLSNLPDHAFVRDNVLLMAEVKGGRDKLRKGQEEFMNDILDLENPNVHYFIIESMADWEEAANVRC